MSASVIPFRTRPRNVDHYFGACPTCGETDGFVNIQADHWFVCDQHRVCWWVGSNLFSCWRDESPEVWQENEAKVRQYRRVEPLPMESESRSTKPDRATFDTELPF